jgi:hypothetical protein
MSNNRTIPPNRGNGLPFISPLFPFDTNTDLELGGGGLNIKVDAEELWGLDENYTVFRGDAFWRITRLNRVDFSYYTMRQDGSNELDIEIPNPKGDSFPVGTTIFCPKSIWRMGAFWRSRRFIFKLDSLCASN